MSDQAKRLQEIRNAKEERERIRNTPRTDNAGRRYGDGSFLCPHCEMPTGVTWCDTVDVSDHGVQVAQCQSSDCYEVTLWLGEPIVEVDQDDSFGYHEHVTGLVAGTARMVWPGVGAVGPKPHDDLPEGLTIIFEEARAIAAISPKGSSALSRLVLQKLLVELGGEGKNINNDIKQLVERGELHPRIEMALDVIRVVGNNAVHPGEINLDDQPELAIKLLQFVNLIVDETLSRDRQIGEIFDELPEGAKDQIARRGK